VSAAKHTKALAAAAADDDAAAAHNNTFTEAAVQSVVHAVVYIVTVATRDRVGSAAVDTPFAELLADATELNDELRAAFAAAWQTHTTEGVLTSSPATAAAAGGDDGAVTTTTTASQVLRLGQLVGLDWQLGVGIASSHCGKLNSPYVSLSLSVADAAGVLRVHPLEMTVPEFRELAKTFRRIEAQISTV
jgi:hypothetical protein